MSAVIDEGTYKALEEAAGAEFVAQLARTFLEEAPRMIEQMNAALAAGDAETFRRAAHSLKSNSATFGALGLAKSSRELELSAAERVAHADRAAVERLARDYADVAHDLQERARA
ncbi:MAG TPA: Hpt domain-containing protein [Usitatibacter sp.]|nr:Hpt domain-containing protein [Usitatibacter sp.]